MCVSDSVCMILGVFDLVFLGVGGMVGSGIYVLVGVAAKEQAGKFIEIQLIQH